MSKILAVSAASALLAAAALPSTADAAGRTSGIQSAGPAMAQEQVIERRVVRTAPIAQRRVVERRVVRTAPRVVERRVVRTAPRTVERQVVVPQPVVQPAIHPGFAHPGYAWHPGWAIAAPVAAAATLPFLPFMALGAAAQALAGPPAMAAAPAPVFAAEPAPVMAAEPVLSVRN